MTAPPLPFSADPATAQTPSGYLTDIRWGW